MRIPLRIAITATILALISPTRFLEFQDKVTKPLGIPAASDEKSVKVVCYAFWTSVAVVIAAAIFGTLLGLVLRQVVGSPIPSVVAILQILGASILLLATVYLRGSAIATYKLQTLIERVDRWIYCTGYFLGTSILVASLTWS